MIFNFYMIKKSNFKNFSRPTSLGNAGLERYRYSRTSVVLYANQLIRSKIFKLYVLTIVNWTISHYLRIQDESPRRKLTYILQL
jgi:hypothetical protein